MVVDLSRSASGRLFLFGALYFAQGVPWGFISVTLALYLTGQGMGPGTIGDVLALSYMPWSFKPLLGPLADWLSFRRGGRRAWIIGTELGMGATLLTLAWLDPRGSMSTFLALIFAHNLFAAAQDVGTDALAVELLAAHDQEGGTANGVMWASKYLGVMVGGAGFSRIAASLGWRWLFLLMAALVLIVALAPLIAREPAREPPPPPSRPGQRWSRVDTAIHVSAGLLLCATWSVLTRYGLLTALWYAIAIVVLAAVGRTFLPGATPPRNRVITVTLRSFALRATFAGLILFLLAPAASNFLSALSVPMLKQRMGYSDAEIGTLNGLYLSLLGAAGAFAGGVLSDRLGRRKAIALFTTMTAVLHLAFGLLDARWGERTFVYGMMLATAFADGMVHATYLSLGMDLSNPAVGGTQFTAFMGLSNVRNSWSAWLGGQVAEVVSAPRMFMLAAAVAMVPLLLLPLVDPAQAKRAFGKKDEKGGAGEEA